MQIDIDLDVDIQMDGQMDGWMDGWMYGVLKRLISTGDDRIKYSYGDINR